MMAYQYTLDLINREVKFNALPKLKPVTSSFKAFRTAQMTFDVLPSPGSNAVETTQIVSVQDTNWSREMIEGILLRIIINKSYLILGVISKRYDPKVVCNYLGIRNFTILTAHTIQTLANQCHTGYQILWESVYKSFLEIAAIKNRNSAFSVINDKLTKLMNYGVQKQANPTYRLALEDEILPDDPILFSLPDEENPGSSILRSDHFSQMRKVENNQPTKLRSFELSQTLDPTRRPEAKFSFGAIGYRTISKIFGLEKDGSQHVEGPDKVEQVMLPSLDLGKLFGMIGEGKLEKAEPNKLSRVSREPSQMGAGSRKSTSKEVQKSEGVGFVAASSKGQTQPPVKSKLVHQALKASLDSVLSKLEVCVIEDEDIEQQVFLDKATKKSKKTLSREQF